MKVKYIDHMGSDLSVVRAATASFAKDPEAWDKDKHPRLINYLARGMTQLEHDVLIDDLAEAVEPLHEDSCDDGDISWSLSAIERILKQYRHTPTHWSPFAHTAITLRLKAPIAIHAQFMKHTVGFAHNTVSRRYVSDTPELFVPEFREKPIGNIKQGSGGLHRDRFDFAKWYKREANACIKLYEKLIEQGASPEQARFVLPQGVMTEWVSTGSLYAWARLYRLRTDPHAQKEIQELAEQIGQIIKPLFPVSWAALTGR